MTGKSAVMCPTCGRTFKSSQGLAGHRRIKHADVPKGAPPPSPVKPDFVKKPSVEEPPKPSIGELYKSPQPPLAYAQHAQPAYPQYSPQPQQPQAPPPTQPSQPAQPLVIKIEAPGTPRGEKPLTEADVTRLAEEAILKIPVEAPPKPEVDIETRLRQAFEEARKGERGWGKVIAAAEESQEKIQGIFKERLEERKKDEESLRPIKEDLGKVGETIAREVKKLYPKEVSKFQPPEAPAKPPEEPTKPPEPKGPAQPEAPAEQQPAGLPMSPGDTILMSERLAREVAAREVNRLLDAKKAKEAEAEKEVKAHENAEAREKKQKEGGQKEEPQEEALPEEVPQEESPEEVPQRRGIFPVFRRRRFRLLR